MLLVQTGYRMRMYMYNLCALDVKGSSSARFYRYQKEFGSRVLRSYGLRPDVVFAAPECAFLERSPLLSHSRVRRSSRSRRIGVKPRRFMSLSFFVCVVLIGMSAPGM